MVGSIVALPIRSERAVLLALETGGTGARAGKAKAGAARLPGLQLVRPLLSAVRILKLLHEHVVLCTGAGLVVLISLEPKETVGEFLTAELTVSPGETELPSRASLESELSQLAGLVANLTVANPAKTSGQPGEAPLLLVLLGRKRSRQGHQSQQSEVRQPGALLAS
ncbi:hypothetical protein AYO44_00025 [Planctomycetaceae bacterium SCGC AG-212-F19]|nr:hypothetical protein AYO44_00025 [Planctomycetaceae bacterium SCGC AG-212-F19]